MRIIIKKKAILFSLLTLFVCFLLALILVQGKQSEAYLSEQKIKELRLDYPIYNKSPEFIMIRPLSFQEVFEGVDSVVIGYIVDDELPNYQFNLPFESESDKAIYNKNKRMGSDQKIEFIQYKLKVEKLVAGTTVNDEIILSHNAMLQGIEPALKTGMKLLLGVAKGAEVHEDKYFFSRYGTYYIVEEDYVLPAYEDDESKKLTGATLKQLIKKITSYRND